MEILPIGQIKDAAGNLIESAGQFISENKTGVAIAGVGSAVALGATVLAVSRKRKKSSKAKNRKRSSMRSKSKKKSYKYARTAGKRRDTSRRRIRMTKSGQPYIILASGKARFISKKSARLSRKRKGGRY